MPEPSEEALTDLSRYKRWKPEAQERALALLKQRRGNPWRPFYCKNPVCNGQPHVWPLDTRPCEGTDERGEPREGLFGHEWVFEATWQCRICSVGGTALDDWLHPHARADQKPPRWRDPWLAWFLKGGRGSGKTRTGSETTNRATKKYPQVILIGATLPDLRETMIEGRSGILKTSHPDHRPEWEPSKKKLTWPNGCIGLGFTAEEPDRLRGPESGFFWGDEPAHWPHAALVWDNVLFGHRVTGENGLHPKAVLTSTPKPTTWVKERIADEETITYTVSTYANAMNLDEQYRRRILSRYEGTRTGAQELHGEVLTEIEGALWNWNMYQWCDEHPALRRIVVGVDPAGTTNKRSDLTGIIVVGLGFHEDIYVLDDRTGKYSPSQWADEAVRAYEFWQADAIVPEKNYGGDMVRHTLENSRMAKDLAPRILDVTSRRGKEIRAEPVVALYEKAKVWHCGDRERFAKLEEEQTEWVPGEGASPNRIDALVHAVTKLAGGAGGPSSFADPSKVFKTLTDTPTTIESRALLTSHARIWTP